MSVGEAAVCGYSVTWVTQMSSPWGFDDVVSITVGP